MNQWLGAIFLIISFGILLQLLELEKKTRDTMRIARHSLKIISSPKLSDEAKERRLQRNSTKLFSLFLILTISGAIALGLPLGILWLCDLLGWLSLAAVLDTTLSPLFIILSSVVVILFLSLKPRKRASYVNTSSYSQLERTLHHLAFNTYTAQIAIADIEDRIFSQELEKYPIDRPVFITALPRAGTTLLLELCASLPQFNAHCYRDMPFVLIPCLWDRFSQAFQQNIVAQDRAHGDGMKISPDSPEALEEVVWKTFWQRHYHPDRIIPWDIEEHDEFSEFFNSHIRKIISLSCNSNAISPRYVSKNNANIARLKTLKKLFPHSITIVPFRNPLDHANSLLQQHLNFLEIHQADAFAAEYMAAIGHYDFGINLRPIDFNNWLDNRQSQDAHSLSFWLEYWLASYQYLLKETANINYFFNYEALCNHPQEGLESLGKAIAIQNSDSLISAATRIRPLKRKEIDTSNISTSLLKEVNLVYDRLKDISLN